MSKVILTEPFLQQMQQVESARVRDRIFHDIELLPAVPHLGSANLPASIIEKYGHNVRKLPITPFLVIYTELPPDDFLILGLMYGRAAY